MQQPMLIPPPQRREHPEPTEQSRPVPWGLLLGVAVMSAVGVAYIEMDGPAVAPELGDQRTVAELRPAAGAATADGAAIYAARCAACHQAAGTGVPGAFPPLAGSECVRCSERRLAALVLHGVAGPLTVQGRRYNGAMPAFGAQLGDAELAAVLTHVRQRFGDGAAPVAPATVAAVRQATGSRDAPFAGEAELAALP